MNGEKLNNTASPRQALVTPIRPAYRSDVTAQGKVLLSRVGLRIPEQLSFADWEKAGRQLAGIVDSSSWSLGDWLIYGAAHYSDRYQRVIRAVGLSYKTLRNYSWVSRRFPIERRREDLSFQHHAEVASLPADLQDRLLDACTAGGWTTKKLRDKVRTVNAVNSSAAPSRELVSRVDVPAPRLRLWQAAARRSGTDLSDWLLSSLDQAAAAVLGDNTVAESATSTDEVVTAIHVASKDE
ncbi:LmbU family transcriptional regulator [Lentzea jiangxiensis]|uniref:Uncharacterized protein n=1 Tax=Lentzea jiangxiensis TaxID=641025 RepID=A0A1H0WU28_9PSEU|nr:LmbU family transcriptional regulator [Lentzea jiangxiensis]SDP94264.1 hypothetical protein SAMN05421507_12363 [Lentzea jiangxiensis]